MSNGKRMTNLWDIAFLFWILIDLINLADIGGAYLIFILKMQFSYLTLFLGYKNFIITDDSKISNKILFGLEKLKMSNDKIALVETNFSRQPAKQGKIAT